MTAYINKLKDRTGNQQLPVTHERAVRDSEGTTLETKLQNLEGAMDKAYVAGSSNGMGRITLKKNIVSGVNTLTQSMMQATNTIYVIRYDFTLGEDITVPANCVLEFDGGSISGAFTVSATTSLTIYNGKFVDVKMSVSDSDIKLYNCSFVANVDSSLDDVISGNNCSLDIERSSFSGTITGTYIHIEGAITTNKSVHSIRNCTFNGNCNYGIRIYGSTLGDSISSVLLENNVMLLESGNTYFLGNCKNAQVYGGEYSSPDGASNLYSCDSSSIIGGYYHDLNRGATIGGRTGKYGIISNVIAKNIDNGGVDIDWASTSEEPFTYSEGYGIISNNIVENCGYGVYVQGNNILISKNMIKWGAKSTNTAIRLNQFQAIADDKLVVTDNIVDCEGQNIYPVVLGKNTTVYVGNNIFKTNNAIFVSINEGSKIFELNALYIDSINEDVNYKLHKTYKKVVIDSSVTSINTFRLQNDNPKVSETLIVNNSSRTIQFLAASNSGVTIYGSKFIDDGDVYKVTYIDALTCVIQKIVPQGTLRYNQARPDNPQLGCCYFDYNLNPKRPIWYNGSGWVDATGTPV